MISFFRFYIIFRKVERFRLIYIERTPPGNMLQTSFKFKISSLGILVIKIVFIDLSRRCIKDLKKPLCTLT